MYVLVFLKKEFPLQSAELFSSLFCVLFFIIGKVYVGGQNRLYQLSPDLEIVATIQTGNENASTEGNMNKVLLIDYNSKCLISCGSNHGQCSTRNLRNISLPEQNAVPAIVSTSKSMINSKRNLKN